MKKRVLSLLLTVVMLVGIVSVGVGSLNAFAEAPSGYYEGYQGTMSVRVFDDFDSGGSHYHETMLQYDWIDIATVDRVNFTIHSHRRRTDKSFQIYSIENTFYKGNGFDGTKTSVSTSILSVKNYSPERKSYSGGSNNYATDIYWQKYFDVSNITSLNGVETYRLETKLERRFSENYSTSSKYATSVCVFYVYCSHTGHLAPTATCTTPSTCSRCKATNVTAPHSYTTETVSPPGKANERYTKSTCTVCGDVKCDALFSQNFDHMDSGFETWGVTGEYTYCNDVDISYTDTLYAYLGIAGLCEVEGNSSRAYSYFYTIDPPGVSYHRNSFNSVAGTIVPNTSDVPGVPSKISEGKYIFMWEKYKWDISGKAVGTYQLINENRCYYENQNTTFLSYITTNVNLYCSHQGPRATLNNSTVTTPATCNSTGVERGTCSLCGQITTKTIPVDSTNHNYGSVVTAPTCTEDGYTTYTCSWCGDSYTDDTVEMLGHDYEDTTVETAATCNATGIMNTECSRCHAASTRVIEIDPNNHDYEDTTVQKAPTATEPGIMNTECSRCGATSTREIPKLDVVFEIADGSSAVINEATGYLCGIHERYSDAPTIESYFNMVGCTLEYTSPGTGSTIAVKVGDNVLKEMTLIIYGDVTGDGIVDSFDVSSVAAVSCYEYEYEDEYFNEAGDVYDDGYVDVIDLAFIISAANCDITIDQRGN